MAKDVEKQASDFQMRQHMRALGFPGKYNYLYDRWCREQGFQEGWEKTPKELLIERSAWEIYNKNKVFNASIDNNPRKFIKAACAGEIVPEALTRPIWHNACKAITGSKKDKAARESLEKLLLFLEKRAKFLFQNSGYSGDEKGFVHAVVRLHDRKGQWVNDPYKWRSKTHNAAKQFSEFLRFVLVHYPVPLFLDSAWFRADKGSYLYRDAFIHIGSGKNLRTAKMPVEFTKKMVHHFLMTPDAFSVEEGVKWAQIHALGGDDRLVRAVLGARLRGSLLHSDFWQTVYRFFIANPMLDRRHVGPIIDFIHTQKFEIRTVLVGAGREETLQPPHPNFTMRGREVAALLRQIDVWHGNLRTASGAAGLYFKKTGILEFEHKAGKDKALLWSIREILSGVELIQEGRALNHCVASYAAACASGKCSIWSMTLKNSDAVSARKQTIEVDKEGVIVQCRGRANRCPDGKEQAIISMWAKGANLKVAPYLGFS